MEKLVGRAMLEVTAQPICKHCWCDGTKPWPLRAGFGFFREARSMRRIAPPRAEWGTRPHVSRRRARRMKKPGVHPDPESMVLVSHWTTPVGENRRFATWFYAAAVPAGVDVRIDGGEIHEHRWLSPREALKAHRAGALPMLPPTYITLCALARYRSTADALAGERESPCPRVLPLMVATEGEGGFATLYPGDAGYESGDMSAAGARHRSFLRDGCWQYQYENVVDAEPLYPLPTD